MAGFAASGALGLGAGAALYIWGYQGSYKEDIPSAATAALTVFAALSVAQRMLNQGDGESESKQKKRKKKAEKNSLTEKPGIKDDSDSAMANAETKTPAKIETKTPAKIKTKDKPAQKPNKASENVQSKQAPKSNKPDSKAKQAEKKNKKDDVMASDSEDEEAFLKLGQKGIGPTTLARAPIVQADSDEEEEVTPAKEVSNSKSAIRRRKQKENKEKAAAAAAAPAQKKPVVDKDGFETVPITKRPAKKPSTVVETKSEGARQPTAYSDSIDLESKQMAILIGTKGETLNALRAACGGVRIETPLRDSGDTKVTISGDEASVKYCKIQIRDLISKGYCSALSPNTTSANMAVSGPALGIIIGPKGVNIMKLQRACDVVIKTTDKGVTISGLKENVTKAKTYVQQIVDYGFSSVTHEGWEIGEVPFPHTELRHLIGPKGHTIKSIRGDTQTQINLPRQPGDNVQVIGPAAGVAKAIRQISTLLERKAAKEAAAEAAAAYNSEDEAY